MYDHELESDEEDLLEHSEGNCKTEHEMSDEDNFSFANKKLIFIGNKQWKSVVHRSTPENC